MATESDAWTWEHLIALLREKPIGTVVQLPISAIEDPESVGFESLPTGADGCPAFGGELDDQTGVLALVAGANYEVRLCQAPQRAASRPSAARPTQRELTKPTPAVSAPAVPKRIAQPAAPAVPARAETRAELVELRSEQRSLANFIAERPGEVLFFTTLLGTAIGAAFGGAKGALAGAMAGGGTGLASIALSTAATSPLTAQMSMTMFLALVANALGGRGSGPVFRLGQSRRPMLPPHIEEDEPPRPPRRPRKR